MFPHDEILQEVVEITSTLTATDSRYHPPCQEILTDLFKIAEQTDDNTVNLFRTKVSQLAEANDALIQTADFQKALHLCLIAAARIQPVNQQDDITSEELINIPFESLIFLRDGYAFHIESIAQWIKQKGEMKNYQTGLLLHPLDQEALIIAARDFDIDLTLLDPNGYDMNTRSDEEASENEYDEEEEKSDHEIASSASADAPSPRVYANNRLTQFAQVPHYLSELASYTQCSVRYLLDLQNNDPENFLRINTAAPFIHQGLLSIETVFALNDYQLENLMQLNSFMEALSPTELTYRLQDIIEDVNSPVLMLD